ncbi:MAG: lamin tail domain-containing protein [Bacteroidales bacterium]|nr:lamin tail domain-containing protein [Bacteroidales bacterium]
MKSYYLLLLTVVLSGYWASLDGQTAPGQGDILITEIMANPSVVSDANGEWIEIRNMTDHDLLLNGLVLKDAGSNHHVLTAAGNLVLPANGYWVLAKNSDILTNGGVEVNYTCQNFTLSNTSDQVILTTADETLIDQVSYDSGWPVVSGASMELHPDHQTFSKNDQSKYWFQAQTIYGAGDKGSPGKPNPASSGSDGWEQEISMQVFPNPSNGKFFLEVKLPNPQPGEIRLINLLGQDFLYKKFSAEHQIKETIEPDFLTPGIWFIKVISGNTAKAVRIITGR